MSDAEETEQTEDGEAPKKKSKLPLILGIVLALVLGGGGFYATYSGMIGGSAPAEAVVEEEPIEPLPSIAFVELEPMVISLGNSTSNTHLRFRGHLEVAGGEEENVTTLMPRVLDVLNSYLRALDSKDFEKPSAMIRLRAQMLRRVQLVVGDDRVKDLLVTEFVLN